MKYILDSPAFPLNPFPNKRCFYVSADKSFENTVGKGEKEKLLVTSNFPFFHNVFYSLEELSAIFIKFEIAVCKLFQFETVKNLSFGRELNKVKFFFFTLIKSSLALLGSIGFVFTWKQFLNFPHDIDLCINFSFALEISSSRKYMFWRKPAH